MSRSVDLRQGSDPQDVIHRAAHLLSGGAIVAFPTETVYVAAAHALNADAVCRLSSFVESAGITPQSARRKGCALAVKSPAEARDYVPGMSALGRKLGRRCWPGPVTLGFSVDDLGGLFDALPAETRTAVVDEDILPMRSPAHDMISKVQRYLPGPLVVSLDRIGSAPPLRTAADAEKTFGENCDLILDDGPCRYGEPSTVVVIKGGAWKLRSPGVVTESAVGRLASEVYLFVCTGNTCRSPLAEAIFRRRLAERMGCEEEELFDRGYIVASAGLSASIGAPASPHSMTVAGRMGIDLRGHESQPVTDRLLDQADHVFTMTRWHQESILNARPDLAGRVQLISRKSDVSDPVGGTLHDYERCAQEIDRHLKAILNQIPAAPQN